VLASKIKNIVVEDCTFIEIDANLAVYINSCFTNESVFKISDHLSKEEIPLMNFDYVRKKWLVGRYIGELFFAYKGQDYCFKVEPRFGDATILHLLEEIFKVKLASIKADNKLKNNQPNQLIKKL